jgi:hypothetical protein
LLLQLLGAGTVLPAGGVWLRSSPGFGIRWRNGFFVVGFHFGLLQHLSKFHLLEKLSTKSLRAKGGMGLPRKK